MVTPHTFSISQRHLCGYYSLATVTHGYLPMLENMYQNISLHSPLSSIRYITAFLSRSRRDTDMDDTLGEGIHAVVADAQNDVNADDVYTNTDQSYSDVYVYRSNYIDNYYPPELDGRAE
jgi:hypothetical protein